MPLTNRPALANLIVTTIKAYAIVVLSPDGSILEWLGDVEGVTGYRPEDVVGRHFAMLFTEPDRAAGVPQVEIGVAQREGRAEDSRWHLKKDGERFWANGLTVRMEADQPLFERPSMISTKAVRAQPSRQRAWSG